MKTFYRSASIAGLVLLFGAAFSNPNSGFSLPDSVDEMTISYRSVDHLIVLPVVINDSISVNLILDTGCRNLVLFGKRFSALFPHKQDRPIQFSGLGTGQPVSGSVALNNKVSIGRVIGERIPIVVTSRRGVLASYSRVDGVIGYDIFLKFEIELNPRASTITFRPAMKSNPRSGYTSVPITIKDSRPMMASEIMLSADDRQLDLMIDTGSSLALVLQTTDIDDLADGEGKPVGIGFNGEITGHEMVAETLWINPGLVMTSLPVAVIESAWHNYASIGMRVLKDYIMVLNYCKAYACFMRIAA